MSELKKYGLTRSGIWAHPSGDYYRVPDVDAARASDKATIAELQARLARSEAELSQLYITLELLVTARKVNQSTVDKASEIASGLAPADGKQQDEFKICEFCGCHTNAKQRFCCDAGMNADKQRWSCNRDGGEA